MRDFGNVRKLPSGRWQATYSVDGRRIAAPNTFAYKADATDWLADVQLQLREGDWIDPRRSTAFGPYAKRWIESRRLSSQTRQMYEWLLKTQLRAFTSYSLLDITPLMVREWHAGLPKSATAAAAYRLLSAIFNTAVSDRLVKVSPCAVRGASVHKSPERPVASVSEVEALADAITPRLRLFVLLAAWCQLRRGELLGLRPEDIGEGTLTIRNTRVLTMGGQVDEKGPKTQAGNRTINYPPFLTNEIRNHRKKYSAEYLFMGERGPMSKSTLYKHWKKACESVGLEGFRIHDLRHTGLTFAAETGATVAELMKRAGHSSPYAAMRYQHATMERDRQLADALGRARTEVARKTQSHVRKAR